MGFFWDLRPRDMHSAGCAPASCSLSGCGRDGKVVGVCRADNSRREEGRCSLAREVVRDMRQPTWRSGLGPGPTPTVGTHHDLGTHLSKAFQSGFVIANQR